MVWQLAFVCNKKWRWNRIQKTWIYWKHVSTSPFLHIKRLVLEVLPFLPHSQLASMIPTILLLMLDPSQPQYIRSKSYSLLHCWPSTTLGHEMTPRRLRKSSPILLIGNSSINPTAFGGGRLESKVVPPSSQLQPPRNWTNNSRKSSSTEMKFLSAFKSSIAAFTLGSQICQESEASHKRFPFYTRVENHGPVQQHVFKMLSTAIVLKAKLPIRSQAACWISVVVKIGRCLEFLSESSDNRNFWTHPVSYLGSSVKR